MYIVMEIQKQGETVSTLVDSYANLNEAKSKHHTILAAASVSAVEQHAASLMDDTGRCIYHEAFQHGGANE